MSYPWMARAACVGHDPEKFFPSKTGVPGQRQAQEAALVCAECPVRIECAQHSQAVGATHGVWGSNTIRLKNAGASSGGPRRQRGTHGTYNAFRKHRLKGEPPCHTCQLAYAARQDRSW